MKKSISLLSLSTILLAVPNAPSNLVLTPQSNLVSLSWSDNSDDESGFKIFRDGTLVAITPSNATHYIDRGLTPSTTYNYMVKATDDSLDYNARANLNSWYIYANNQENALKKVYNSTLKKDVISLKTYNGKSIAMKLGSSENDSRSVITWEQNIKGSYKIYLKIKTTKGDRYLTYLPNGSDRSLHDSQYLDIGITPPKDGEWSSVTRDIAKDLKRVENDNEFISFDSFLIRAYNEAKLGSITLSEPSTSVTDGFDVEFTKKSNGVELNSIKYKNEELSSNNNLPLFSFIIRNNSKNQKTLDALSGWSDISISDSGNSKIITLKNPTDSFFPSSLIATITVNLKGDKSSWNLKINGVGSLHSLMYVTFPQIDIKASNNDRFFTPFKYGRVDKVSSNFSYGKHLSGEYGGGEPIPQGLYPMGWRATMAYMAYYNNRYGLYFGFHDKDASIKNFVAKGGDSDIVISCDTPVENMTKMGNSFDFPGHFELDYFKGDWYDASMIYKDWVYNYAEYKPSKTLSKAREKLANITVWGVQSLYGDMHTYNSSQENEATNMKRLKELFNNSVGFGSYYLEAYHQDEYGNSYNNEYNFPKFYPSNYTKYQIDELKSVASSVMLYTNAYLYSQNIINPDDLVAPFSSVESATTKREDGSLYIQDNWKDRNGKDNPNAIMCPTQTIWQDTLANVHRDKLKPLNIDGVLIDQVTASSPVMCFDKTHNHPLGGGHYWRDGYVQLINKLHQIYGDNTYIVSETFNDSLVDVIDGYEMVKPRFIYENSVPAIESVYGGKVQFIGNVPGTTNYANSNFYTILAQAFIFGDMIGYMYPDLASSPDNSKNYIKKLVEMKEELKDFIALGEMKKPLSIIGDIGDTSGIEMKRGSNIAHIKAIQSGTWSNGNGDIAIVFINALAPNGSSLTFQTNFKPSLYNLKNISVKEIDEDGNERNLGANFPKDITLRASEIRAYIISK